MTTVLVRSRDIEVEVRFLTREQGGRSGPVTSGYRPQFFYDGHDWDAVHEYPDTEWVHPGQTVRAFLCFLSPGSHVAKLGVGSVFQLREGQHVIGEGKVTRILELADSARRLEEDQGAT